MKTPLCPSEMPVEVLWSQFTFFVRSGRVNTGYNVRPLTWRRHQKASSVSDVPLGSKEMENRVTQFWRASVHLSFWSSRAERCDVPKRDNATWNYLS